MSGVQFGITIAACTAATMLTRFLPFLIFSSKDQQPPEVVRYLGRCCPPPSSECSSSTASKSSASLRAATASRRPSP